MNDLAALYYNPGRLGLIENPAFLLNVDVFELTQVKFKDAVGEGANRKKTDFGSVPSFVAGTFKIKWLKGHHFGYSILQRQAFDLNFKYRNEKMGNIIEDLPGEELFGSSIDFNQKVLEAEPHVGQSSGDTIRFSLIDDLKSVTNFGIGAQIYVSDKLSTYLSVSTDFSVAPESVTGFFQNEPIANNMVFSADLFHFAGGVVLTWRRTDIALGAAFTGGAQEFARPVDFPDESDDGIFDGDETGTFRWNRMRVILVSRFLS